MSERVAVIGAAGVVAGVLIPGLEATVVGVDVLEKPASLGVDEWHRGSVSDAEVVRRALEGCTAVIHLATGAPEWEGLLEVDMIGLKVVADAALDRGVSKVIYASSNHVVGMHERDAIASRMHFPYPPDQPPRPDSPYGAAKAFGEAYCRYLAERTSLSVSCLRIGTVRSTDDMQRYLSEPAFEYIPGGREAVRARLERTWLFHGDLVAMFREELDAPEKFRLRFAISPNPDPYWSREVLIWDRPAGGA